MFPKTGKILPVTKKKGGTSFACAEIMFFGPIWAISRKGNRGQKPDQQPKESQQSSDAFLLLTRLSIVISPLRGLPFCWCLKINPIGGQHKRRGNNTTPWLAAMGPIAVLSR